MKPPPLRADTRGPVPGEGAHRSDNQPLRRSAATAAAVSPAADVHKTVAWPLALAAACLIVYASLYPFDTWRDQGIQPWQFLTAPLPKYWTWFDVVINVVGYAPLGFLIALGILRGGHTGFFRHAITFGALGAGLLSLCMESLQTYLPSRIPSNVDLSLNTAGAWLGAVFAWTLEKAGVISRWGRFRERWFAPDARGALVLLTLWPVALLFPASVPMGLGQVFERLEAALAETLLDTPFLEWMPVREVELQPLVPLAELICVFTGALIPCLIAYCVVRTARQRAVSAAIILILGLGASALSSALTYGPDHTWAWFDAPVQVGLGVTAFLAAAMLAVPKRLAAALALLALATHLGLLNQAPPDPYFAQTLQTWEQGRFIRFHGLVQWLGWIWPYAALLYVLVRLSGRERKPAT